MHSPTVSWRVEASIRSVKLNFLAIVKLHFEALIFLSLILKMLCFTKFFILLIIIKAIFVIECMSTVPIVSFLSIRSLVMTIFV